MRVYEELFIVKPDAPEEEVDGFIEQVKQVISTGHGNVDKVDNWGIRKLAYEISKYHEGRYVLVVFSSSPELVHEVERRMRVADLVIKFITVRIDEKAEEDREAQESSREARGTQARAAGCCAVGSDAGRSRDWRTCASGTTRRTGTGSSGACASRAGSSRTGGSGNSAGTRRGDEGKE